MSTVQQLKEMFEQMVVAKDASQLERYYDPGFQMISNGITQDYADFARGHVEVYATPITYDVRYDEDAWVESDDRVGGRVWITTTRPGEAPTEIEVVLLASFVGGRPTGCGSSPGPTGPASEPSSSTPAARRSATTRADDLRGDPRACAAPPARAGFFGAGRGADGQEAVCWISAVAVMWTPWGALPVPV